jgi:hypothetical protein
VRTLIQQTDKRKAAIFFFLKIIVRETIPLLPPPLRVLHMHTPAPAALAAARTAPALTAARTAAATVATHAPALPMSCASRLIRSCTCRWLLQQQLLLLLLLALQPTCIADQLC